MDTRVCPQCGKEAYRFPRCPWCNASYSATETEQQFGELVNVDNRPFSETKQPVAREAANNVRPISLAYGFSFSLPVALLSWVGLSSELNNVFWPLTIACVLISLPWSLLAGFAVGMFGYPVAAYLGIDGYIRLYAVFYASIILGAHFNGYLVFQRRTVKSDG